MRHKSVKSDIVRHVKKYLLQNINCHRKRSEVQVNPLNRTTRRDVHIFNKLRVKPCHYWYFQYKSSFPMYLVFIIHKKVPMCFMVHCILGPKPFVSEIVVGVDSSWYQGTILSCTFVSTKNRSSILELQGDILVEELLMYKGISFENVSFISQRRVLHSLLSTEYEYRPSRDHHTLIFDKANRLEDLPDKYNDSFVRYVASGIRIVCPNSSGKSYIIKLSDLKPGIETVNMRLRQTSIVDAYRMYLQNSRGVGEVFIGYCLVQPIKMRLGLYRLLQQNSKSDGVILRCLYDPEFDKWYPYDFRTQKTIGTVKRARMVKLCAMALH